ncbi:VapE domain-containing protein [Flavobacterium sp. 25HG05S-40]|uniref:VapE domain-containing protein n=1 Tax=Flavobacterium sp. 25HG05S-40 TaxID=3458682 RepID=UPI00404514A2
MLEDYLNNKYEFRYDEILSRTFYKEKNTDSNFELLRSYKLNSIKRELNNGNIPSTLTDLKCLLESDYVSIYNPFIEYFKGLPKWDGKTDYIQMLTDTIKTTNQIEFSWAFKKWIVAAVSCAINEEITNQAVLIFTGEQGLGKTTWLKRIVPEQLKQFFFSGIISPTNKDTTLLMAEKFIINMDEMASLNKKQIEAFKEMVTKGMITERRAYAHFTENYTRRASFVGSSNHNELLMDVTGNRRFLCFEAIEIDYEHTIDMDKVYSQIMYILQNDDFKYHFEKEDITRLEENNKMFIQSSEENDWIDELFSIPDNGDLDVSYLNATDVKNYICQKKGVYNRLDVQLVGKIMKSKGFQRKKINGIWKYIVKENKG